MPQLHIDKAVLIHDGNCELALLEVKLRLFRPLL